MVALKSLAVLRVAFMDRVNYRGDVFAGLFIAAGRVLLAGILWTAVFDERSSVAGYTLPMMLTYYLVGAFVRVLHQSEAYVWEYSAEIRSGLFGKYLVRPVKPLRWFLAVSAGRSLFTASLALPAVAAVYFLAGRFAPLSPLGMLAAVPIVILGINALSLLDFLTAILAFRFTEITAFQMVKGNIMELASGALVPLALMPAWARVVCAWTPFPALVSLPAELCLGLGYSGLPSALAMLAAWNLGLVVAAKYAFAALSDRYEEVGA